MEHYDVEGTPLSIGDVVAFNYGSIPCLGKIVAVTNCKIRIVANSKGYWDGYRFLKNPTRVLKLHKYKY